MAESNEVSFYIISFKIKQIRIRQFPHLFENDFFRTDIQFYLFAFRATFPCM